MKICLIGCGRIAHLLEQDPLRNKPCTHWGGMKAAKLHVTHACDTSDERLKAFSREAGIHGQNLFTDCRDLFKEIQPDLVTIATWTPSHAPIGIMAAEAGARVIVCEKPVSASLRDAAKLIDACRRNRAKLIINHERRFDPRYRTAARILESGKIGELRSVHAVLPTGRFRGPDDASIGGGSLLHDGTHLIDMVRFFAGDAVSAKGTITRFDRKKGFEDHAAALLETKSGVQVFVETGGAVNYFGFGLELRCSSGMIAIGNGYNRLYISKRSSLYTGFRDLTEVSFPKIPKGNCFSNLYREAKELLEGSIESSSSSGSDGYKALEIIHGIYHSWKKDATVYFPLRPNAINIKKIFDL